MGCRGEEENFGGDWICSLPHGEGFMSVYMSKLIKVHILNTCSLLCQLNLNKTLKPKRRKTDGPSILSISATAND